VLLFLMLVGTLPFHDRDPVKTMHMHAKQPPPRIDEVTGRAAWCTPELVALVEGALIKDPDHRFASAAVMIECLDHAFHSLDALQ
jgi:hypothetical protein